MTFYWGVSLLTHTDTALYATVFRLAVHTHTQCTWYWKDWPYGTGAFLANWWASVKRQSSLSLRRSNQWNCAKAMRRSAVANLYSMPCLMGSQWSDNSKGINAHYVLVSSERSTQLNCSVPWSRAIRDSNGVRKGHLINRYKINCTFSRKSSNYCGSCQFFLTWTCSNRMRSWPGRGRRKVRF